MIPMRELVSHSIGGGWGEDIHADGTEQVAIIRGADFPGVAVGDTSAIPRRWESIRKLPQRTLQPGDIVLESSGGTSDRPTGRTVFISEQLLDRFDVPVIPASFCRLVRIDPSMADPHYVYWWLQGMYADGRTWGYQNRSTGIANFQFQHFLDAEKVSLPTPDEQRAIASTLGALDDKIESNRRQVSSLNRTGRSLYEAAVSKKSISVPISELIEHRPGKHLPKADYRPGSITVYGSNSVMGLHDTPLYGGPFAVMARIGSYCGSLHWTDEAAWVNNNASALLPRNDSPSWILRHALEAVDMSQFRVGTGQPFIAVKALMETALQMPAESMQDGLNQDLRSISRLASQRLREIDALSALRDALLPELLSGRLRAAGVEVA